MRSVSALSSPKIRVRNPRHMPPPSGGVLLSPPPALLPLLPLLLGPSAIVVFVL
ncbi:hypothetical protein SPHINGOAX6_50362 [Sphingomonas sp. AX6]|nr:hypothetical protein SPHINGOAX6_50362 [Sphingomonas sp. AX6]